MEVYDCIWKSARVYGCNEPVAGNGLVSGNGAAMGSKLIPSELYHPRTYENKKHPSTLASASVNLATTSCKSIDVSLEPLA